MTAIEVISPPPEKFITCTAPVKEKPLTVAAGTAAYPIGAAVGITMLAVGPVVSTAKTVLLLESNAATMFREGEIAINPGEPPAERGDTRAIVSLVPLTKTRLPKLKVELTPWEARTRFFSPLGGFFLALLPQEMKLRLAHNPTMRTRMLLFKRHAPNDMKKEDLIAKCWIITDSKSHFMVSSLDQAGPAVGFSALSHA